MELLSTVHWVATREEAATASEAVTRVHAWSKRKQMFEPRHIHLAWERLRFGEWLA
jgi:hypothetical protein